MGAVWKKGTPTNQSEQPGSQRGDSCSSTFPDDPCGAGASGMGGSFSLPEYQQIPVQPHKAMIRTWTHQVREDRGVSHSGVIFRSLEKLTVRRTETSLRWICTAVVVIAGAGPEAK